MTTSLTSFFVSQAPTLLSAAGALAIFVAALLVLHAVDVRRAGAVVTATWLIVALCSAWFAAAALSDSLTVPWPLALLTLAVACIVWADLDAVLCRASCAQPRPAAHIVHSPPPASKKR